MSERASVAATDKRASVATTDERASVVAASETRTSVASRRRRRERVLSRRRRTRRRGRKDRSHRWRRRKGLAPRPGADAQTGYQALSRTFASRRLRGGAGAAAGRDARSRRMTVSSRRSCAAASRRETKRRRRPIFVSSAAGYASSSRFRPALPSSRRRTRHPARNTGPRPPSATLPQARTPHARGDYIILGSRGGRYPMSARVFALRYEVIPHAARKEFPSLHQQRRVFRSRCAPRCGSAPRRRGTRRRDQRR